MIKPNHDSILGEHRIHTFVGLENIYTLNGHVIGESHLEYLVFVIDIGFAIKQ
jgi:hypothetical protein